MRRRHAALLLFLLTLAPVPGARPAGARSDFGGGRPEERYFAIEWSRTIDRRGRTVLQGYLTNRADLWVTRVVLRVEALDAAGRPVAAGTGWVGGDVPARGRVYFEVLAPGPGAAYRVTVQSFDWLGRGPSARRRD